MATYSRFAHFAPNISTTVVEHSISMIDEFVADRFHSDWNLNSAGAYFDTL